MSKFLFDTKSSKRAAYAIILKIVILMNVYEYANELISIFKLLYQLTPWLTSECFYFQVADTYRKS